MVKRISCDASNIELRVQFLLGVLMYCKNCRIPFVCKTLNQLYCSASCRNIDSVRRWRRVHRKKCPNCDEFILPDSTHCKQCYKSATEISDMTLGEAIYLIHHCSSAYSLVRTRARAVAKKLGIIDKCFNCGYNKHVEIAHKKKISSFSLETMISVINEESNLIALCRNCHWEFDHGLLILE